jgi:hypothetical protein
VIICRQQVSGRSRCFMNFSSCQLKIKSCAAGQCGSSDIQSYVPVPCISVLVCYHEVRPYSCSCCGPQKFLDVK